MSKPSVLVTFDSMKDANCGYFSFGKGLGDALIQENHGKFTLKYYLFKKTQYLFNGLVDIIYLTKLDRLFFRQKNDFDVVHLSDQTCRLRPNRVNAKKIMTIHDMNKVHLKFSRPHRIKVYLKKLGKLISQCDNIVCISEFVANDVKHYFPEASNKISVIYNGADKLISDENHQPAFKPGKKFLFTIGLLSVQKGFHLLPALLKDNDFELVIAGRETPHKERILEEAKKYNCQNRVHIIGQISDEDKAWYYKNCSAFLFPSIAEGFGLPVIEAMHFGKPVFLSKFTSLPEVGGDVAYYFDSFEPEHMQDVFKKGLIDFTQNDRNKEAIVQAEKFSWKITANQYLDLYQEILHK
ncbi:glycosyltransferase [Pedobacter petrophilus]|uniref:Glycosyltransferase n=1 Tax=Pedobacter petrophilus TaxID=1908241 RepID=A0A7K0FZ85_9SPHI|nr:glycosyltransferase family 1 protein [Pedobacter petrophilus]MRX76907.1 glycosyltransferase [Pedobacter petrophilus]